MTTRAALIRLAYAAPAQRSALLRMAREFATEDALKKYLEDHPGADPKKHSVKKTEDKGKAKEDAPAATSTALKELLDIEDLDKKFEDATEASDADIKEFTNHPAVKGLDDLNLNVIAGDDDKLTRGELTRAMHVAAVLKQNLDESADFCKMNPPACEGNLGITRDNMPQIMDKPISKLLGAMDEGEYDDLLKKVEAAGDKPLKDVITDEDKRGDFISRRKGLAAIAAGAKESDTPQKMWFDALKESGIEVNDDEIEVGKLIASQAEIKAGKSYGIAKAYLTSSKPDYSRMPKKDVKALDKKLEAAGLDPDKLAELDDDEVAKVIPDRETLENYAAARGENFHALPDLPILVARDPKTGDVTVIDGHHRYAGLLLSDPKKKMKVKVIETGIQDALDKSFDVPGVFRADLQDNIVDSNKPLDLARKPGDTWQQRNGKWYAKNSEGEKGTTGGPFDSEDAAKNFASGKKASLSRRDRDRLVRLASSMPKGHPTRRGILAGLRTHDTSIDAPMRRRAKFPEGKEMTIDEVAAVVGPEFKEMNENPPASVKKVRKKMEGKKAALVRLAATLPKGHPERRTLLAMVGKSARRLQGEPLYDRIKQIVDEKQYARINGVDVDMTTANLLVQVADKLNPSNRSRFLALDIPVMVGMAWRVAR
jgi:hypothetical protein